MSDVSVPTFVGSIDQNFLIEPLNGSAHPRTYLYRFPDTIYNTSTDSRLVKFIYALLGPAGIGWFQKQLLETRLQLEAQGFDTFDIESFYGDPFSFGRIIDEMYESDPSGLLTDDEWNAIKARDESYRSRAITFFNAARLGTSPGGMSLAAQSGLAHNVEIIENYKYLFDQNSDDRLGLPWLGQTHSTAEFIVLPRPDISQSEVQTLAFDTPITSGTYRLIYNGITTSALDATTTTTADVQAALEGLPGIGRGNVHVTGDLTVGFTVQFQNALSNQDVSTIGINASLVDEGTAPFPIARAAAVEVNQGGVIPSLDRVTLSPTNLHNMQTAIDFLRPVGSIPTLASAYGKAIPQEWSSVLASSEYNEVLRFVTGNDHIAWPSTKPSYWIQKGVELEAPRVQNDLQQHYVGFHNIGSVTAYGDAALADEQYETDRSIVSRYRSEKAGRFSSTQALAIPFLSSFTDNLLVFTADRVRADYSEPITVATQDSTGMSLVNGIYPIDYSSLAGIPVLKYKTEHFWASTERVSGADYLEIDLGEPQAVNFLSFECIQLPLTLEISFDTLDQSPRRHFIPVTPVDLLNFPMSLSYNSNVQNPWTSLSYLFTNSLGRIPFTRFIRIGLNRTQSVDPSLRFLYDQNSGIQYPYSIEVRNLRVGRNVIV